MTPEKIQELAAIDQKIADASVNYEAAYLALKEAVTQYRETVKAIQA